MQFMAARCSANLFAEKVAAWLIPSYERAVELLQEIADNEQT